MQYGHIKTYSNHDGFGYIEVSDGTVVYFHQSSLTIDSRDKPVAPGQKVYFSIMETRVGLEAANVRVFS